MRILLIGSNGQVGWELHRVLLPLGEIIALDFKQLDLTKTQQLREYLQNTAVDVIINAAAYTAVDKAETEPQLADCINHIVPDILARHAKATNVLLIHYSTDYVFDGAKDSPFNEQDVPAPLSVYGKTKLAGELAIQAAAGDYLIFRTSWVYAARGHNFLLTIRQLAAERKELNIVADQIGSPTWARLVAQTTAYCLLQAVRERRQGNFVSGLYHLTSSGETSWFGFAEAIVGLLRDDDKHTVVLRQIKPINTEDYPTPARRPANSRLDVSRLERKFELVMPEWNHMLQLCIDEIR